MVFECCIVEFLDDEKFSFKVGWAWFRRFVAGVRVVSAKVPAFVAVLPGVRRVGSFLGLFRVCGWLAGPGCWFCLFGRDLCLLGFRSGQEKGSFCGGGVMGPSLLVVFGLRSPE